jgi:hypothetical protein
MFTSRMGGIAAVVGGLLAAPLQPAISNAASPPQSPGKTREWPCRIVVEPPLLRVVEDGWRNSESFRRQCDALANKRAVAELRPGPVRTGSVALTRISIADDGVVVGRVSLPMSEATLEYIAHELEHILERAEGVNLKAESRRNGSGVWRSLDGFETQRAIDKGRQVAREVRENSIRAR